MPILIGSGTGSAVCGLKAQVTRARYCSDVCYSEQKQKEDWIEHPDTSSHAIRSSGEESDQSQEMNGCTFHAGSSVAIRGGHVAASVLVRTNFALVEERERPQGAGLCTVTCHLTQQPCPFPGV